LTDTLKPPTLSDTYSPIRSSRPVSGQAAIRDKLLGKSVRKVINGRSLLFLPEELGQQVGSTESGSDVEDEGSPVPDKVLKEVIERIDLIPEVSQGLLAINPGLGNIFHRYCGVQRLAEQHPSPRPMVHLFQEVSSFWI